MKKSVVSAALVAFIFAASAEGRPPSDWPPLLKVVKRWVVKTFGDEMSVPKP